MKVGLVVATSTTHAAGGLEGGPRREGRDLDRHCVCPNHILKYSKQLLLSIHRPLCARCVRRGRWWIRSGELSEASARVPSAPPKPGLGSALPCGGCATPLLRVSFFLRGLRTSKQPHFGPPAIGNPAPTPKGRATHPMSPVRRVTLCAPAWLDGSPLPLLKEASQNPSAGFFMGFRGHVFFHGPYRGLRSVPWRGYVPPASLVHRVPPGTLLLARPRGMIDQN